MKFKIGKEKKLTDKAIAEKIATHLGYKLVSDCWWEKLEKRPNSIKIPDYELEKHISSWTTFGLIIEKAEEMGWNLIVTEGKVYFSKDSEEGWEVTCSYTIKERGYFKAVFLAFLECFRY